MSNDTIPLPRALTAENGAKAALSGEFFEPIDIDCPECDGDGETGPFDNRMPCEDCEGRGFHRQQVPVTWTTIKAIWRRAVEHFTKPAPTSDTPPGVDPTVHATLEAFDREVARCIEEYEFDDGDSYHVPNELERLLITDAVQGLLSDDQVVATFMAWRRAVEARPSSCLRPFTGDDGSAADCIAKGHCGCGHNAPRTAP